MAKKIATKPLPWFDPERERAFDGETKTACEQAPPSLVRKAKALLRRMKGKGWKLHVWENCGYYFAVYNGPLSVHTSGAREGGPYFCLLSDREIRGGGALHWHDTSYHKDPNKAVEAQVKLARAYLDQITAVVEHVESLGK